MQARSMQRMPIDSFWTLPTIRCSSKLTSGQRLSIYWSNIIEIAVTGDFFTNYYLTNKDKEAAMAPSCFSRGVASKDILSLTLKDGQNLTSGQGHVMTEICHVAYLSMRLDETSIMKPSPTLCLISIKIPIETKTVASNDIWWPFKRLSAKKRTLVIIAVPKH